MEAGIAILELERRESILPNHRIMENHAAPNMQPTLGLVKVQDVAATNTKTLIHLLIIHLLNIEPHCIRGEHLAWSGQNIRIWKWNTMRENITSYSLLSIGTIECSVSVLKQGAAV